jgi:hypothetical protein
MRLIPLKANQTELHTNDGAVIFFSYKTPVAAQLAQGGFVRTSKRWSVTTSKHITQWLAGAKAAEVDQSTLDAMV